MEKSRELFIKAFMEAESYANSKLKSEEEIDWKFSEKFEKSMNKLIKKNSRIVFSTRQRIKKGLIAAIIAIVVLFTGLMSVSATRTPFVEILKKVFSDHNEISITEESIPPVDTIETEYTLSYIPDGYKLKSYDKGILSVLTIWSNDRGEDIIFDQFIMNSGINIDTEHGYEELNINGYEAYYFTNKLLWTDGTYWFSVSKTNADKEELLELSKSLTEKSN